MTGRASFRCASNRHALAWLMALDALFRLPSRLLAWAAGAVDEAAPSRAWQRPANDNVGALSAKAVNCNGPRRLA